MSYCSSRIHIQDNSTPNVLTKTHDFDIILSVKLSSLLAATPVVIGSIIGTNLEPLTIDSDLLLNSPEKYEEVKAFCNTEKESIFHLQSFDTDNKRQSSCQQINETIHNYQIKYYELDTVFDYVKNINEFNDLIGGDKIDAAHHSHNVNTQILRAIIGDDYELESNSSSTLQDINEILVSINQSGLLSKFELKSNSDFIALAKTFPASQNKDLNKNEKLMSFQKWLDLLNKSLISNQNTKYTIHRISSLVQANAFKPEKFSSPDNYLSSLLEADNMFVELSKNKINNYASPLHTLSGRLTSTISPHDFISVNEYGNSLMKISNKLAEKLKLNDSEISDYVSKALRNIDEHNELNYLAELERITKLNVNEKIEAFVNLMENYDQELKALHSERSWHLLKPAIEDLSSPVEAYNKFQELKNNFLSANKSSWTQMTKSQEYPIENFMNDIILFDLDTRDLARRLRDLDQIEGDSKYKDSDLLLNNVSAKAAFDAKKASEESKEGIFSLNNNGKEIFKVLSQYNKSHLNQEEISKAKNLGIKNFGLMSNSLLRKSLEIIEFLKKHPNADDKPINLVIYPSEDFNSAFNRFYMLEALAKDPESHFIFNQADQDSDLVDTLKNIKDIVGKDRKIRLVIAGHGRAGDDSALQFLGYEDKGQLDIGDKEIIKYLVENVDQILLLSCSTGKATLEEGDFTDHSNLANTFLNEIKASKTPRAKAI